MRTILRCGAAGDDDEACRGCREVRACCQLLQCQSRRGQSLAQLTGRIGGNCGDNVSFRGLIRCGGLELFRKCRQNRGHCGRRLDDDGRVSRVRCCWNRDCRLRRARCYYGRARCGQSGEEHGLCLFWLDCACRRSCRNCLQCRRILRHCDCGSVRLDGGRAQHRDDADMHVVAGVQQCMLRLEEAIPAAAGHEVLLTSWRERGLATAHLDANSRLDSRALPDASCRVSSAERALRVGKQASAAVGLRFIDDGESNGNLMDR